jgi:hypothetical protein
VLKLQEARPIDPRFSKEAFIFREVSLYRIAEGILDFFFMNNSTRTVPRDLRATVVRSHPKVRRRQK